MISRTTRTFWKCFDALSPEARRQAARAYVLWRADPFHGSLRFKCISEAHGVWSARIGLHWRALGTRDGGSVIWFWIGSHADYDRLIG